MQKLPRSAAAGAAAGAPAPAATSAGHPETAAPGDAGVSRIGASTPSPDVAAHLQLVDKLLTEVCADLAHLWSGELNERAPVDVLGNNQSKLSMNYCLYCTR